MPLTSKRGEVLTAAHDAWKAEPTDDNFNTLLNHLKPTVDAALFSYAGGDETLRLKANILASQALSTYDPKKSALNTHVMNSLHRLSRVRADRQTLIHVPENQRFDSAAITRFKADYRDQHGHEPDMADIQDGLSMSKRRITNIEGHSAEVPAAKMVSEKGDMPAAMGRSADEVWADYVYHDLDPIGRKVLEWTTGYNGREILSKTEIARRLGVSAPAVSARISRIMAKLDEGLSNES